METEVTPPDPGIQVPDHELLSCVGKGTFGRVWLARSLATGRLRAVKTVLRSGFTNDRPYETEFEGLKRFEEISREHVGFIDILHISKDDQGRYFTCVMEVADDLNSGPKIDPEAYSPKTLDSYLRNRGALPPAECIQVGLALTAALAELHERSLVHRDIKPSNIVYVRGAPKLADVGLVTDLKNQTEIIRHPATIIGTPHYMDEAVHGTAQGDLYGLGKVLYVMATGSRASDWPTWPSGTAPLRDPKGFAELERIFLKACQPDRSQRYQSAGEIHADLLLLQAGVSAERLRSLEKIARAVKRLAPFVLMAALFLALAAFFWSRQKTQAAELRQRRAGSYVAYGTQAMENRDYLGALPWFAEALRLDHKDPANDRTHRLRLGTILHYSPSPIQMWFRDRQNRADFAGEENQVMVATTNGNWAIHDLGTGEPLFPVFGSGLPNEKVSLSRKAGLAITSVDEPSVRVWNLATGNPLPPLTYEQPVHSASISPDGNWAAAAIRDGTNVVLWDTVTRQTRGVLVGHTEGILHLAFSPDGRRLATSSRDRQVMVWNVANQNRACVFARHGNWVYHAAFSPDGSRIASASFDRTVRVWNATNGLEDLPPLIHGDGVRSVEFSHDGTKLVTAGLDFAVRVWDSQSGELLLMLRHNSKPVYAAFSPLDNYLLTAAYDGTIRVWKLRPNRTPAPTAPVWYSANGARFLSTTNQTVVVFGAGSRLPHATLTLTNLELHSAFWSDAADKFVLDLKPLPPARGGSNQVMRLFNASSAAPLGPPVPLNGGVTPRAISPSGTKLLTTSAQGVQVWNLETGLILFQRTNQVEQASFDFSDRRVAVAFGRTLQIWPLQPESSPSPTPFDFHTKVGPIEWSRDGNRLVAGCWDNSFSPEAATILDAATGQPVASPLAHRDGVRYATFSPDSRRVITCGEDFCALVWDAQTGRQLTPRLRHNHQVLHATFSEDGRWVATGCRDGTARIWDAATGEPLTPPLLHLGEVSFVQFIDHSDRLFTKTVDGQAHLWNLGRDDRSVEELSLIAQLLSADRFVPMERVMPQTKDDLRKLWQTLHERFAEDFSLRSR